MQSNALERPDYQRVRTVVRDLHRQFGCSEPPVNPVEIARGLGLEVRFVELSGSAKDRISGFYELDANRISINRDEYPLRQTFTTAHELGHAILHKQWAASSEYRVMLRDQSANEGNPYEKEANFFAAHLLVPRFMLDKYYDILDTKRLSRLFAVSVPVIEIRIANEYGLRA